VVSHTSAIHFFFSLSRPPPSSPLFPYTTLFRSACRPSPPTARSRTPQHRATRQIARRRPPAPAGCRPRRSPASTFRCATQQRSRSEEHTSELQSRENLVCRLLLEKKKKRH